MKELPTTLCIHCGMPIFLVGTSIWKHLDNGNDFCNPPSRPYLASPPEDINMDEFAEAGMEALRSWADYIATFGE